MSVTASGVNPADGEIIKLYQVTVLRGMRVNTWLMYVVGVAVFVCVLTCIVLLCLNRRQ